MTAHQRWLQLVAQRPECAGDQDAREECRPNDPQAPTRSGTPAGTPPTRAQVTAVAREVVLGLQLPDAAPHIGPDPGANEWDMAVVGLPIWLWTEGPRSLTTTRTVDGITFVLTARQGDTVFDMGDGTTVICTATQPYPSSAEPGTASPVCGHTYTAPSGRATPYPVRATTRWQVSWSALGHTGTLPAQLTGSRPLVVGELHAVLTR